MKFLNSFNENNNNDLETAKKYLESKSYIDTYTTKENFGKLSIRYVRFINIKDFLYSNKRMTLLSYDTLFIYMLILFLDRYTGENEFVLKFQEIIQNYNQYNEKTSESLRILNQMPRNNILIKDLYFDGLVKTKNTKESDYIILADMIRNIEKIFTEENFIKWYRTGYRITSNSNEKEKYVVDLINNNNKILLKNAKNATGNEDIGGVDIIAYTNSNERKTIQVKMFSKLEENRINEKYYTFKIFNTKLDLNNYDKGTDGGLEYDFLFLISDKDIISINSKSIMKINKDLDKNTIEIKLYINDIWFNRMIKRYSIKK